MLIDFVSEAEGKCLIRVNERSKSCCFALKHKQNVIMIAGARATADQAQEIVV